MLSRASPTVSQSLPLGAETRSREKAVSRSFRNPCRAGGYNLTKVTALPAGPILMNGAKVPEPQPQREGNKEKRPRNVISDARDQRREVFHAHDCLRVVYDALSPQSTASARMSANGKRRMCSPEPSGREGKSSEACLASRHRSCHKASSDAVSS